MKEKRSILRRGLLAVAMTLGGFGAAVAVAAAPAGASNTEMTAVGSFTTFFMMHALFPELNDINPNPEPTGGTQAIASDGATCSGGITYSTSNPPPNGSGAGKTALNNENTAAANEQGCIDFGRSSSPPEPNAQTLPNGLAETGDIGGSTFDYYAYALDGVAPLVGSDAPATVRDPTQDTGPSTGLSLAQIRAIYECVDTNWNQITVNGVSGANAPIVLFWPQAGSGTRSVYQDVLGFSPVSTAAPSQCTTNQEPITSFSANSNTAPEEENSEDGIIYENSVGDPNAAGGAVAAGAVTNAAMYIYSAGKFSSAWNDTADNNSTANNVVLQKVTTGNPTNTLGNFVAGSLTMATVQNTAGSGQGYVDLTAQIGRFNQDTNRGTVAVDGNTVAEANEWYSNLPNGGTDPTLSAATIAGIRYVYNVADTSLPGYNGAKDLIGFDNQTSGSRSVLCNGDMASTITAQGFLPLTFGSGAPSGSDAAGSTCREFPGLSYPGQGTPIHWTTPTFDNRAR